MLLSVNYALHLSGNSVLPPDFLEVGTTQNPDWQPLPASFASTAGFAMSIRAGRSSQASLAVSYIDACHIDVYIVVYLVGHPGC